MSENLTEPLPTTTTQNIVPYEEQYIPYMSIGVLAIIANVPLIASLCRVPELRKKYVLQLGLAGGDLCCGLGYLSTGAVRLGLVLRNYNTQLVTALTCMLRPNNLLMIFGNQVLAIMINVISVERFVAIAFPVKYYTFNRDVISKRAIAFAYSYALISVFVFGFVGSYLVGDVPAYPNLCTSQSAMGPIYGPYDFGLAALGGVFSVLLYTATIIIMRVQTRRLEKGSVASVNLESQRALTKMMGIVAVVGFFFFVIPAWGLLVFDALPISSATQSAISPYIQMVYGSHSFANVVVYVAERKEIREAIVALFGEKLPGAVGHGGTTIGGSWFPAVARHVKGQLGKGAQSANADRVTAF